MRNRIKKLYDNFQTQIEKRYLVAVVWSLARSGIYESRDGSVPARTSPYLKPCRLGWRRWHAARKRRRRVLHALGVALLTPNNYECTWDLYKNHFRSTTDSAQRLLDEIIAFNTRVKGPTAQARWLDESSHRRCSTIGFHHGKTGWKLLKLDRGK